MTNRQLMDFIINDENPNKDMSNKISFFYKTVKEYNPILFDRLNFKKSFVNLRNRYTFLPDEYTEKQKETISNPDNVRIIASCLNSYDDLDTNLAFAILRNEKNIKFLCEEFYIFEISKILKSIKNDILKNYEFKLLFSESDDVEINVLSNIQIDFENFDKHIFFEEYKRMFKKDIENKNALYNQFMKDLDIIFNGSLRSIFYGQF